MECPWLSKNLWISGQPRTLIGAMEVSSSRDYLFVANTAAGSVTVMDIITGKVAAVVAVGAEPRHVAVTPDNRYAIVLNSRSGDVAVILRGDFESEPPQV